MQFGVLAGYSVEDIKVTLQDGAYHDVDSSELAFKIAGSMVFKEAAQVRLGLNLVAAELQQAQADLEAAQKELAERKAGELAGVVEAASQPMLVTDGHLVVVAANLPCHDLFGYRERALAGRSLRELVAFGGRERDESGQECTGTCADGSTVALRVSTSNFGMGSMRFMAVTFSSSTLPMASQQRPPEAP